MRKKVKNKSNFTYSSLADTLIYFYAVCIDPNPYVLFRSVMQICCDISLRGKSSIAKRIKNQKNKHTCTHTHTHIHTASSESLTSVIVQRKLHI